MKRYLMFIALLSYTLIACKQDAKTAEATLEETSEVTEEIMEKDGITLSTNSLATQFEDARLSLLSPVSGDVIYPDSVLFRFGLENYELGANTADPLSGQCANSGKGQHIHFILNNEPYTAHYEAEFKKQLPAGNNVLLAFLSRSYHMSVKTKDAYLLTELPAGDALDEFDETAPHLFYSRPKGSYEGEDAKKVMLDFFLVNTDLEEAGYMVRASINGVGFDIDKWQPYFIEGLREGENTITLELLDAEGNLIPSPFNPVSRTISIKY